MFVFIVCLCLPSIRIFTHIASRFLYVFKWLFSMQLYFKAQIGIFYIFIMTMLLCSLPTLIVSNKTEIINHKVQKDEWRTGATVFKSKNMAVLQQFTQQFEQQLLLSHVFCQLM